MRDREICRTIDVDESMAIYGPDRDSQEEPEKVDTEVELSKIEAPCWNSLDQQKELENCARNMKESSLNVRQEEPGMLDREVEMSGSGAPCCNSMAQQGREVKESMRKLEEIRLNESELGKMEEEVDRELDKAEDSQEELVMVEGMLMSLETLALMRRMLKEEDEDQKEARRKNFNSESFEMKVSSLDLMALTQNPRMRLDEFEDEQVQKQKDIKKESLNLEGLDVRKTEGLNDRTAESEEEDEDDEEDEDYYEDDEEDEDYYEDEEEDEEYYEDEEEDVRHYIYYKDDEKDYEKGTTEERADETEVEKEFDEETRVYETVVGDMTVDVQAFCLDQPYTMAVNAEEERSRDVESLSLKKDKKEDDTDVKEVTKEESLNEEEKIKRKTFEEELVSEKKESLNDEIEIEERKLDKNQDLQRIFEEVIDGLEKDENIHPPALHNATSALVMGDGFQQELFGCTMSLQDNNLEVVSQSDVGAIALREEVDKDVEHRCLDDDNYGERCSEDEEENKDDEGDVEYYEDDEEDARYCIYYEDVEEEDVRYYEKNTTEASRTEELNATPEEEPPPCRLEYDVNSRDEEDNESNNADGSSSDALVEENEADNNFEVISTEFIERADKIEVDETEVETDFDETEVVNIVAAEVVGLQVVATEVDTIVTDTEVDATECENDRQLAEKYDFEENGHHFAVSILTPPDERSGEVERESEVRIQVNSSKQIEVLSFKSEQYEQEKAETLGEDSSTEHAENKTPDKDADKVELEAISKRKSKRRRIKRPATGTDEETEVEEEEQATAERSSEEETAINSTNSITKEVELEIVPRLKITRVVAETFGEDNFTRPEENDGDVEATVSGKIRQNSADSKPDKVEVGPEETPADTRREYGKKVIHEKDAKTTAAKDVPELYPSPDKVMGGGGQVAMCHMRPSVQAGDPPHLPGQVGGGGGDDDDAEQESKDDEHKEIEQDAEKEDIEAAKSNFEKDNPEAPQSEESSATSDEEWNDDTMNKYAHKSISPVSINRADENHESHDNDSIGDEEDEDCSSTYGLVEDEAKTASEHQQMEFVPEAARKSTRRAEVEEYVETEELTREETESFELEVTSREETPADNNNEDSAVEEISALVTDALTKETSRVHEGAAVGIDEETKVEAVEQATAETASKEETAVASGTEEPNAGQIFDIITPLMVREVECKVVPRAKTARREVTKTNEDEDLAEESPKKETFESNPEGGTTGRRTKEAREKAAPSEECHELHQKAPGNCMRAASSKESNPLLPNFTPEDEETEVEVEEETTAERSTKEDTAGTSRTEDLDAGTEHAEDDAFAHGKESECPLLNLKKIRILSEERSKAHTSTRDGRSQLPPPTKERLRQALMSGKAFQSFSILHTIFQTVSVIGTNV